MVMRRRLSLESMEKRLLLASDGVTTPANARVCNNVPDHPNCIIIGDVDGDDAFTSSDLVAAFAAGKFLADECATYEEGDWNQDGRFDFGDFDLALSLGYYDEPDLAYETFFPGIRGQDCPPPDHAAAPARPVVSDSEDAKLGALDLGDESLERGAEEGLEPPTRGL